MINEKIIVDARGHVAGKLAAEVAKKLLEGYDVTVISTEDAILTGPLHRRIGKYKDYKRKRCIVNPERGAFHYKEPSTFFRKILRTMVPRKTKRGSLALERLHTFESIPKQFENLERVKFPAALTKVTNSPNRKFCTIGQLLSKFGWKHGDLAKELSDSLRERENLKQKKDEEKNKKMEEIIKQEKFQKKLEEELKSFK